VVDNHRDVVIIGAAPAAHMHGFVSRDGVGPAEFLATGREEVARGDTAAEQAGTWARGEDR
jgi:hypothetical protein